MPAHLLHFQPFGSKLAQAHMMGTNASSDFIVKRALPALMCAPFVQTTVAANVLLRSRTLYNMCIMISAVCAVSVARKAVSSQQLHL